MALQSPSKSGLIALTTILFTLQLIAVIGRFAVRRRERVKPWADDYLALAAFVFFFAFYFVAALFGVTRGSIGQHLAYDGDHPVYPNYTTFVTQYIFAGCFMWVIGLARLSIIYLYRRIFPGRTMRIICNLFTVFTVIWIVSFFVIVSLDLATQLYPNGKDVAMLDKIGQFSINPLASLRALAVTDVLFDLTVLVIPWPWIWNLQMRRSQKFGVAFVFILGNLTLSVSIVRCYYLVQSHDDFLHSDLDFTYVDGANLVWSQTETATAIICSCLPNFGRIILKGLPSLGSIDSRFRLLLRSVLPKKPTQWNEIHLDKSDKQQDEPKGEHLELDKTSNKPLTVVTREVESV